MTTIFTNIRQLINARADPHLLFGKELGMLPSVIDAYLVVEDDRIAEYGSMKDIPPAYTRSADMISVAGQTILPCWCDSHTHIVFAGSRENEFLDKIRGLSYAEIAANGGGILNSAGKLRETPEDELFNQAYKRLGELTRLGTGSIEIKSGYGLTTDAELKMLRVIQKLKEKSGLLIKSTFLGAHTYPAEFQDNHDGYVKLIIEEMLPAIAREKLADFVDVFCEKGFFSPAETEVICMAAISYGLRPKLHVNQLNSVGGIEAGIKLNALSLDHLETLSEAEIKILSGASTSGSWRGVCTLLPSAAFFLRMPFQPARKLIDAGCAIALASDYNPGSSPSGNMNLVISMACIQMLMMPEEAINAATINGAFAMGVEGDVGTITIGKKANVILTKTIPGLAYLPYSFGTNLIDRVMINGSWVN